MTIEVRKRCIDNFRRSTFCGIGPYIYVVVQDGRRIDSFLRRTNAEAKAAQLRRTLESASPSTTVTRTTTNGR